MWTFRLPERLAGGMVDIWCMRALDPPEGGSDIMEIEGLVGVGGGGGLGIREIRA